MSNTLKFGNGEWYGKKDTILAYNDENSNFKPLPFSFDRASSATVVNKDGLIETVGSGEPRIDFSNDAKGALLLEPTRSNNITYSEDFSQGSWTRPNINVTPNVTTAPNGTTTADLIIEEGNGGSLRQAISVSGQLTFSFYLKYASGTNTSASLFCTDSNQQAGFNLQTGVVNYVSNSTATIENAGNGWYRCSITFTSSASSTILLFPNYESGIGGVYAWGAQVEQGSYATSYIPTQGGVVTRVADVCNNGGNEQVINSTEGVLYAEISALDNDNTSRRISLSDSTSNNHISIDISEYTDTIIGRVRSSNIEYAFMVVSGINQTNTNKIALKYKSNDCSLWINGSKLATDTSVTMPIGLSELSIDKGQNSNPFYGNIKETKLYNTALTDSELQALTSN